MFMKKNVFILTLIALFAVFSVQGQGFSKDPAFSAKANLQAKQNAASNAAYYKLGYCTNDAPGDGEGVGGLKQANIEAMIKIPASMVNPFLGASIAGVNVGLSAVSKDVTVFVRESMKGANILSATLSTTKIGWNEVIFPEALELENKDYYIGYNIPKMPANTYPIGASPKSSSPSNAFLLNINGGDFDDYTSQFGALTIQALLDGDEAMFGNKLDLIDIELKGQYPIGSEIDVPILVSNYGNNDINEIELTYKYASNEAVTQTYSTNLKAGNTEVQKIIVVEKMLLEESGSFTVTVHKVNGVEVDVKPISKNTLVYDASKAKDKKVLLEQFTTEKCPQCPGGQKNLVAGVNSLDDPSKVVWVAHHAGYYTDAFTIEDSEKYLRFYTGGGTYAPAYMLDRTIFEEDSPVMFPATGEVVKNAIIDALEIPTFLTVDITQENVVTDETDVVNITVTGEYEGDSTPAEDLYLVVMLTENGISSNNQSGGGRGYVHNNLLRVVANGTNGTKITWDENKRYSVTTKATLEENWVVENMDIVAFVAKSYLNKIDNAQVLNAEKTPLKVSTNVEDIFGESIYIYSQNGRIFVDGEYTAMQVYSIDGKELNNSNLQNGVYLVKVQNNEKETVKKIIVK